MTVKKLTLKAKSAFSELFTADQLWGQMVWAISDLEGENRATEVVSAFQKNPPFLISAAMPEGYLPMPFLSVDGDEEILKHNRKNEWVSHSNFLKIQKDPRVFGREKFEDKVVVICARTDVKASIDRATFRSFEDGGLHNETFQVAEKPLSVFLRFESDAEFAKWKPTLDKVIDYWNKLGIGGNRNVGYGEFSIVFSDLTREENQIFSFPTDKGFMSVSKCFGRNLKPENFKVEVYSGIVGRAEKAGGYNKRPVVCYLPGSVFHSGKGTIANEMNGSGKVSSYGYAFPVGIALKA